MSMIRVGVVGGTGKLGREIIRLLMNHADLSLGAVITRKGNVLVGKTRAAWLMVERREL